MEESTKIEWVDVGYNVFEAEINGVTVRVLTMNVIIAPFVYDCRWVWESDYSDSGDENWMTAAEAKEAAESVDHTDRSGE